MEKLSLLEITNLATMKKLLTILLTLFLFGSAYAEVRVVDKLEYRDGIAYAVGESEGFSGTWVNVGTNGNKASELNYKDGLQDGLTTKWFPNGAKGEEANYKNGKLHGTATEWTKSRIIISQYRDGKLLEAVSKQHPYTTKQYEGFDSSILIFYALLFWAIFGYRKSKDSVGEFLGMFTILYLIAFIYSAHTNLSGGMMLILSMASPFVAGAWILYGLSRLFKKRFKKR